MYDTPPVTIVTPSFNAGRFIEETIRSVLAQDYPAIEYIVRDGGSTDGTLAILRRYEPRLRWVSQRDGGQSAAINAGWRGGRGEIVAWLNADDTYLPDAVRRAVAVLQAHPQAVAVFGDCDMVDAHGQLLAPYTTGPFDLLSLVCGAINRIPQPAVFIRRAALAEAGWLDERLHLAMDFDLWLRLGLQGPLHYLPQRLATLRIHSDTKTLSRQADLGPEFLMIYQRLFARPDLPAALRAREAEAMGSVLLMVANNCYMAGRLCPAWRYLYASLRRFPAMLRRRTAQKLLVLRLFGRPGWQVYTNGRERLLAATRRAPVV